MGRVSGKLISAENSENREICRELSAASAFMKASDPQILVLNPLLSARKSTKTDRPNREDQGIWISPFKDRTDRLPKLRELRSMSRDSAIPSAEVEVLEVQRRRRWSAAEKQRLVEETLRPG